MPHCLRYRGDMSRLIGALGIAAVTALGAAIFSLLVAVLFLGSDQAVVGALVVALAAGFLALPVAWWLLGSRLRAAPGVDTAGGAR